MEHPLCLAGAGIDSLEPPWRCFFTDRTVGDDIGGYNHVAGDDRRRSHSQQVAAAVVGVAADGTRDACH